MIESFTVCLNGFRVPLKGYMDRIGGIDLDIDTASTRPRRTDPDI